ncbi:sirohydrochlorin chelatase [Acaryochloris sp. CCMEE 5410]|uniref:sirohydrochlorin chelatase n=1 Tax=Acaryochloris sp. CCMEE 5410 TaxID=310037 RepID=UPI0002483BB3|nr:sirohydrochlorin chelatase [Acaryochloris sp. CCMEE 5410]KAI9133506.1 sirohydrochlorin chelatase [Acaryochloris sp. CCMEE 5410]
MSVRSAYLLVAHGSRDPRSQASLHQLGEGVKQSLQSQRDRPLWVKTATLEFGSVPLKQQICNWGQQLTHIDQLVILPLFLLPGTHVRVDIPDVVTTVRQFLPKSLEIEVRSHLGSHPNLFQILRATMAGTDVDRWILLSHGSRYPGGNQPVEALAQQLDAAPAYWSVSPSLRQTVTQMAAHPGLKVGIKPYFLFTGSIIDTISQEVDQLKCDFKHINLTFSSPLEPSAPLVHLIQDLITA